MPCAASPRTIREQAIDLAIVTFALLLTLASIRAEGAGIELYPQPFGGSRTHDTVFRALHPLTAFYLQPAVLALLGCALLWWRRRWPVPVAVTLLLMAMGAPMAVPLIVALFTVAVERPPRAALWCAATGMVPLVGFLMIERGAAAAEYAAALLGSTLLAGAVGWGLYIRSRSELLASWRERAERAEAEAALRAERAQRRARAEVAREMHDVLGHRLSLLSVHAGALEFHPSAPASEVARAAGVIRESAHQALGELRNVLTVLRDPGQAGSPGQESTPGEADHNANGPRPLPTLADLDRLLAEARLGGSGITLAGRPPRLATLPDVTSRAAYRVIQEGLTNARKHAGGAPVTVSVQGGQGKGLRVEVVNGSVPDPPDTAAAGEPNDDAGAPPARGADHGPIPGTGQGLIGLIERVALAGGRLSYGEAAEGFRLTAWLPWPA